MPFQPYKVKYLINGKLLGISNVTSQIPYPQSIAFFCPECGDIWGRVWYTAENTRWTIHTSACERHEQGPYNFIQVPGSLLEDDFMWTTSMREAYWPVTLDYLPKAVLERELLLAIKHYERNYNEPEIQESSDELLKQLCSA